MELAVRQDQDANDVVGEYEQFNAAACIRRQFNVHAGVPGKRKARSINQGNHVVPFDVNSNGNACGGGIGAT